MVPPQAHLLPPHLNACLNGSPQAHLLPPHLNARFNGPPQAHLLPLEHHLALVQLGEVEDVAEDAEQAVAAVQDGLGNVALLRAQRARQQQLRVQGCMVGGREGEQKK